MLINAKLSIQLPVSCAGRSVVLLEKWSQESLKMKMLETMHSESQFCTPPSSALKRKTSNLSCCLSLCRALTFVYPYGATLTVMKPAVAVLSTGSVCFPLNRPVLAFYQGKVRGTV